MDIILDGEQIFEYRIKFTFEPSDKDVERVKRFMESYDVVDCGAIRHTIFQTNPVDFPHLDAGEIYIMDVSTSRALQLTEAIRKLAEYTDIPECCLNIRNMAEPLACYESVEEDDLDFDETYEPKLFDKDYKDAPAVNIDENMGDKLSDNAAAEASKAAKAKGLYSQYMAAGFGQELYPTAKSDVKQDGGPTKE